MSDDLPARPADRAELVEIEERHERDLAVDRRTERRLSWRELGCLLLVAGVVLVRQRYLV